MKVFLHIFLYLSVSVCSLFFVIWFLTSSPFVETAEAADPGPDNSIPSVKEEGVKPLKPGDADVNSPSVVEAVESESKASPDDVQRVPAESSPPSPNTVETDSAPPSPSIPPPPPLPENKDSASGEPSPPDMLENKDSASGEPSPPDMLEDKDSASVETAPLPPAPETEDSLTEMLESNDQFHEDKGSNKEMVKSLMDLNKKVVDMYKMLSSYQYDTADRRDPFVPFKEAKEVDGKKAPIDTRECTGDEYHLNDIKLVGIQWGSKKRPSTAMFRSPAESFFLQKNDCLGQSKATIYRIEEGRVVFIESRTLNPDRIKDESAFSFKVKLLSRGEGLISK